MALSDRKPGQNPAVQSEASTFNVSFVISFVSRICFTFDVRNVL